MPRDHRAPSRAIQARTYHEARVLLKSFVDGTLGLQFLNGAPGLSKSQLAQEALGDRPHVYVECQTTRLALYCRLYHHRDQPVVIDDEYCLIQDPGKLPLMSCLGQTKAVKTLAL